MADKLIGDDRSPAPVRDLVAPFYYRLWNEWDDEAVDDTLAPNITFRGSLVSKHVLSAPSQARSSRLRRASSAMCRTRD